MNTPPISTCKPCLPVGFVNPLTGGLVLRQSLISSGVPVYLFYYSSNQNHDSGFGGGWASANSAKIAGYESGVTITRTDFNGAEIDFLKRSSGETFTYDPPPRIESNIKRINETEYREYFQSGLIAGYKTDIDGRISYLQFGSLNRTTFNYTDINNSFELSEIINPAGQRVTFNYSGSRFSSFVDNNDKRSTFTYDSNQNLSSVMSPLGCRIQLRYNSNNLLTSWEDPEGYITSLQFTSEDQVESVEVPGGSKWTFSYNTTETIVEGPDQLTTITVDRPNQNINGVSFADGWSESYQRDVEGRILSVEDSIGSRTTYQYSAVTSIASDTRRNVRSNEWPDGSRQTYTYINNSQAVKEIEDEAGGITTYNKDNSTGFIRSVVNANGNITSFTYYNQPADKLKVVIEDPLNNRSTNIFDAILQQELSILPNQERVTFSRSSNHFSVKYPGGELSTTVFDEIYRPIKFIDQLGFESTQELNSRGMVNKVVDSNGNITTFGYGHTGGLSFIQGHEGGLTTYSYNSGQKLKSIEDANGGVKTFSYNLGGKISSVINSEGYITTKEYDKNRNIILVEDPERRRTTNTYDNRNRKVKEENYLGSSRKWKYDTRSNISELQEESGEITTYIYDNVSKLISKRNSDSGILTLVRDASGREIRNIDENGGISSFTYSTLGQIISSVSPENGTTTFIYNRNGFLIGEIDAVGNRATYVRDSMGREVGDVDPLNNRTTLILDSLSNIIASINPLSSITTYTYNNNNQKTGVHYPGGSRLSLNLDPLGNVVNKEDPDEGRTTYVYNNLNQLVSSQNRFGFSQFIYGGVEELNSIILPNNLRVTNSYDWSQNYLVEKYSDQVLSTISYGNFGQIVKLEKLSTGIITNIFDKNGRIIATIYPIGKRTSIQYDKLGKKRSVYNIGSGHSYTYSYDLNGSIRTTDDSAFGRTTLGYDQNGLLQFNTLAGTNDSRITYLYDKDSKVREIRGALNQNSIETYQYDKDGNLLGYSLENDIVTFTRNLDGELVSVQPNGRLPTTYSYLGLELVKSITEGNYSTVSFTYSENKVLTKIRNRYETNTYQFDSLGRLIKKESVSAGNSEFKYNNIGKIYSYSPSNNQFYTYSYNNSALPVSELAPGGDLKTWSYFYDGKIQTIKTSNDSLTFSYDLYGRVSTISGYGSVVQTYAYDSDSRLKELRLSENTINTYAYYNNNKTVNIKVGNLSELTLNYDSHYNIQKISYPGELFLEYDYDNSGRNVNISALKNGAIKFSVTFQFYNSGNLKSVSSSSGLKSTFIYDSTNRLSKEVHSKPSVGSFTFEYFSGDRRAINSFIQNDQISTINYIGSEKVKNVETLGGISTYNYLDSGAISSVMEGTGQILTYQYDQYDRLTKIFHNNSVHTFVRDVEGRVVELLNPSSTNTITYDLNSRPVLINRAGVDEERLVWTPNKIGFGEVLANYQGGNLNPIILTPAGDAIAFISSAGDLLAEDLRTAFGKSISGQSFHPIYGYKIKYGYLDLNSSAVYSALYRDYSNEINQFLSVDKVSFLLRDQLADYLLNIFESISESGFLDSLSNANKNEIRLILGEFVQGVRRGSLNPVKFPDTLGLGWVLVGFIGLLFLLVCGAIYNSFNSQTLQVVTPLGVKKQVKLHANSAEGGIQGAGVIRNAWNIDTGDRWKNEFITNVFLRQVDAGFRVKKGITCIYWTECPKGEFETVTYYEFYEKVIGVSDKKDGDGNPIEKEKVDLLKDLSGSSKMGLPEEEKPDVEKVKWKMITEGYMDKDGNYKKYE